MAVLLLAGLGTTWAAFAAIDRLNIVGAPDGAEAAPLLLLWVGYALLASLLYPLLILRRPRVWVNASLMATTVFAGIVIENRVASAIPTPDSSAWGDHPNETWTLVLQHTGVGLVFVLALSMLAMVVLWRDGAPALGSAIVAGATCPIAVSVALMHSSEFRAMTWGIHERAEINAWISPWNIMLALFFVALVAVASGLWASIRMRRIPGIVLCSMLLLPIASVVLFAGGAMVRALFAF